MTIKQNELHLWHANESLIQTSPEASKACLGVLNTEEAAKAKRFHFKRDQEQYLLAHGMLRFILSHYDSAVLPEQWSFNKSQYGKWSIANPNPLSLTFNLSHTRGGVVILVARDAEVGVDIENNSVRSQGNRTLSIAKSFFSASEVDDLQKQAEDTQKLYFLRLWTLKESYIKAIGQGLSADLNSFSFGFPETDKLNFINHAGGACDVVRSWHYESVSENSPQSDADYLVSITSLGMKQAEGIRLVDFARHQDWGKSTDRFTLFAMS